MKQLEQQSADYADDAMERIKQSLYDPKEIYCIISDAYEQGRVDRDTRDMKPETQDEFFNGE